ncbi:MAG TPA: ATP-binding protein [Flavobacterium sp.]|nr:ATP-binding protein [Flavobacterium sp.]
MRYLLFLLLSCSLCFSQQARRSAAQQDSTSYYLGLASFNIQINNYKDALANTQKAIDYAKAANNTDAEANAALSLGILYVDLQKYSDAAQSLNYSIQLFNKLKPSAEKAVAYYNLGLCQIQQEEYSKAEESFNLAEKIYNSINIPDAIALLNLQKGIVYYAKGKVGLASSIFAEIIGISDKNDTYKTKAEALYYMGCIEADRQRNNMALNYLNRALTLNAKYRNPELQSQIYNKLSTVHSNLSDIEKSYTYLRRHIDLRDSIQQINNEKLGAEDYAQFKESERMKAIEQLDKENKQQERAGKFAKLISILAIALISILSLLSLSLYKNNIIRNQSNLLLQEKNKELQIAKDKAEKASKARSEFLSTVSHELRTPLNAINGITHLLLEENPKESQMNYLKSLKFSGDYLLTFINEILEINRIESHSIEVEMIHFNLKSLLANIQNSLKEQALKNSNQYLIDIDDKIPDLLIGDPTKLSQIFLNLINNALKFTKNGVVKVTAHEMASEDGRTRIHFEVIDTGIGIPEDKLETVFDSFSQGSIEINRKYGGTGLGLNIVKKLIEILGGTIALESTVGKGSKFSFNLDFEVSEGLPDQKTHVYDEAVFEDKMVLLIEDNKINQMITKKMLENKKMRCEIIDNGEDAIEAVRNNEYDLVLMDVHLPGINGTTATQTIRTFDTNTPIIALTAISLNENREILLSYGMNDVITKPFNPEDFYRSIANTLVVHDKFPN